MALLTKTYADRFVGTLSCFDRVSITGSLVDIACTEAMGYEGTSEHGLTNPDR